MERKMWTFQQLFFVGLLLGAVPVWTDFDVEFWSIEYIYHSGHDLLLMIFHDTNSCYFAHTDAATKAVFDNCYWEYMRNDVYSQVQWADSSVLGPSSLDAMRAQYKDILADYQCTNHKIYTLNMTFGEDYSTQCQIIGK